MGRTGCTVILSEPAAVAAVDVRGGAPGTIDTDRLAPGRSIETLNAVLLTGGSLFGLAAYAGVMRWLDEHGIGYAIRDRRVPLVSGAVIFDLAVGDHRARPDAASGYAACVAATREPEEGAVGAGTGATVAKGRGGGRPGGLGIASARAGDATVCAVVAVNAIGGIWDDDAHEWVAPLQDARAGTPGANTTIGAILTDAALTRTAALRVAIAGHDGLARAVRPAHTDMDGDTLFALSAGEKRADPVLVQVAAADAVGRAIVRGVRLAARLPRDGTMDR